MKEKEMKNKNIDPQSLEPIWIETVIDKINGDYFTIDKFIQFFEKVKEKAKTQKFEHVRIVCDFVPGGVGDDLSYSVIYVKGQRIETEKEWHERLENYRNSLNKIIEDAQRVIKNIPNYKNKIEQFTKAIEKSKLRCSVCKEPTTMTVFWQNKSLLMCIKCLTHKQSQIKP